MPSIEDRIREIIQTHFDDSSMEVEADSDLMFEAEFAGVDVLGIDFMPGFAVVATNEDSVDIALEFACSLRFKADFSWSVWDSVDREYVSMGSDRISREQDDAFVEIVGKFPREFVDVPEILSLEASIFPEIPDFGLVEPHWRGEEE